MKKIAVLIPCYNEEMTISKVVADFKRELPKASIYVYDNNSSDDTYKVAEEAGASVKTVYEQGKGNVIREMFEDIDADIYVMVDGDDTYEAADVHKLIKKVERGAAMAIGDRLSTSYFTENKLFLHSFGNRLVRWLINLLYSTNISDVLTGYRAFSKSFVKQFPAYSKGFELETEMTIYALNHKQNIASVPVDYRDRPEGSKSKVKAVSDGFKIIWYVLKSIFRRKCYLFFGAVGIIFGLYWIFFGNLVSLIAALLFMLSGLLLS